VVWRGWDRVLDRAVAFKVLDESCAADPDFHHRIRDEARITAAVSHPHVTQVYDFGECEADGVPVPYIVMELVRGTDLQESLRDGALPPDAAMRICAQVAAALAATHAAGMVHRDIKPANVMVTPDGVKVVDFGIAAVAGSPGSDGSVSHVLGTPAYVSPERLIDEAVTPASDVYALGVLLYCLLAGHAVARGRGRADASRALE
jgi:serine/threonine-protein kinase